MRDRWVSVYIALLVLQLPLYYWLGAGPLNFDFIMQAAEQKLTGPIAHDGEKELLAEELDRAQAILFATDKRDSRQARIDLARGLLAWRRGDNQTALRLMEDSREVFQQHHGANSFHSAALDLRIGELEYLVRQYPAALIRFQRSTQIVRDYLGPAHSFPLRMTFREVAVLVALDRVGEAVALVDTYLDALLGQLQEHDAIFLSLTGDSLDLLLHKGLVRVPPAPATTWKSYFDSIERPKKSTSQASGD